VKDAPQFDDITMLGLRYIGSEGKKGKSTDKGDDGIETPAL
jgi:hypothetical protein